MLSIPDIKAKILFFFLLFISNFSLSQTKADQIFLTGWPFDTQMKQALSFNYDPLMRTMLCPSLTRLNLDKLENETVLLSTIVATNDNLKWKMDLKEDVYWWDGKQVTSGDLEQYLLQELPKLAKSRELNIPDFTVIKDSREVQVVWSKEPDFGPYILNNRIFYKEDLQNNIICTGKWRLYEERNALELRPLQSGASLSLVVNNQSIERSEMNLPSLRMRMGEEIHPKGYKRQVEATLPCETKLDTPFVSLVAWNTAGKLSSDSRFRRAMTMLLPRGAIMRAGAGGLGDLISAPILRNHPGYKKSQLVPPYEPLKAEAILNELGYRRSEQDGFRRDQSGNPVQMTIYVADYDGSTLLRKVLDDSFRALGFRIIFTPKKQDNVDGHLLVVRSPWPDGDLSSFLQDRDKEYGWTWTYSKTELDAAVSAYSRSLTFKKPDFRLLERVHEVLASQDFFSILMHHRICLDSIDRQGNKVALMPVNQRNPDWLVALLRKIAPK